jgi:hypothetical protein
MEKKGLFSIHFKMHSKLKIRLSLKELKPNLKQTFKITNEEMMVFISGLVSLEFVDIEFGKDVYLRIRNIESASQIPTKGIKVTLKDIQESPINHTFHYIKVLSDSSQELSKISWDRDIDSDTRESLRNLVLVMRGLILKNSIYNDFDSLAVPIRICVESLAVYLIREAHGDTKHASNQYYTLSKHANKLRKFGNPLAHRIQYFCSINKHCHSKLDDSEKMSVDNLSNYLNNLRILYLEAKEQMKALVLRQVSMLMKNYGIV